MAVSSGPGQRHVPKAHSAATTAKSECSPSPSTEIQNLVLTACFYSVWYSQCIPLAAGQSSGAEVRTLTTAFTLDGPYPTVISTRITYLQPRPTSSSPVEVVTVTLTPDEPCDHDFYC